MIVNMAVLKDIFVNLRTDFNKAFERAEVVWPKIAMLVPSTGSSADYKWLSKFPKMREWIGEKVLKRLEAFGFTLVNKKYEATVEVDRDDIEDDQIGIYGAQAKDAGQSAKEWPDELVMALVDGGFDSTCYDGQYFYDTDHPVNGASVSNKGMKALDISTQAKAKASYGAARTSIRKMEDDEGRPLNLTPDTLLVPQALEDTANALMTSDRLEDGKPNLYKGTAKVVVDARLTSDTAWFLLVTHRPIKPFIFQLRKKPVFVEQTNMNSDDVFMKGKYKFGTEARGNAGYGLWQMAYGSTGTA